MGLIADRCQAFWKVPKGVKHDDMASGSPSAQYSGLPSGFKFKSTGLISYEREGGSAQEVREHVSKNKRSRLFLGCLEA
jgi:hypothetical protein